MIDGVAYVGFENGVHTFHLLADNMRPVMCALVDAEGRVLINKVGAPLDDAQTTRGKAHWSGEDVPTSDMPCGCFIITYLVPRAITMFARLHVPVDPDKAAKDAEVLKALDFEAGHVE